MGPCTANARRPTVDSRCHGTTVIVQSLYYFALTDITSLTKTSLCIILNGGYNSILFPYAWRNNNNDSSSSRVALVASRWEDPVQAAVLAGSQVASGTHVPNVTYNVFAGTLNLAQSISQSIRPLASILHETLFTHLVEGLLLLKLPLILYIMRMGIAEKVFKVKGQGCSETICTLWRRRTFWWHRGRLVQ